MRYIAHVEKYYERFFTSFTVSSGIASSIREVALEKIDPTSELRNRERKSLGSFIFVNVSLTRTIFDPASSVSLPHSLSLLQFESQRPILSSRTLDPSKLHCRFVSKACSRSFLLFSLFFFFTTTLLTVTKILVLSISFSFFNKNINRSQ